MWDSSCRVLEEMLDPSSKTTGSDPLAKRSVSLAYLRYMILSQDPGLDLPGRVAWTAASQGEGGAAARISVRLPVPMVEQC